ERYLPYCDELTIASRGKKTRNIKNLSISSGPKVKYHILPNLSTIKNRRDRIKELKSNLRILIKQSDILIARMPSVHAYHAIKIAQRINKPYVVEVVGDAF